MAKENDLNVFYNSLKAGKKISVHGVTNAECLNCYAVEKEMFRAGALIFCPKCFPFKTKDPVRMERVKYLRWLKKWEEKYGN